MASFGRIFLLSMLHSEPAGRIQRCTGRETQARGWDALSENLNGPVRLRLGARD
jgi:hypothetical protein